MDDREIDLVAENIDVALRMGVLTDSALKARQLAHAERLVVAMLPTLHAEEFHLNRRICSNTTALFWARVRADRNGSFGAELTPVYFRTRLKLSAAEGVREAVLAGQGFAIASRWRFAPELKSGEVASVLDEWTIPRMDLWVIYPSGRLTSAKARAFIKWFEKHIRQAP
jgi:DNA-binding transcriptional LysR family regulator